MSGYVTISRRLFTHELWVERREFSRAEAWIDLIQTANWQPAKQLVNGKRIDIDRGQLLASNRYLMQRWGWKSLTKVQSFLKLLVDDEMIRSENVAVTSRITICKYDTYNLSEVTQKSDKGQVEVRQRSGKGQAKVRQEVKSNNIKEEKESNKEITPIAQAGGFDFEKLANAIGRTAARLIQEGNVGQLLPNNKKKQLFKWLSYRHEKGWPTTTTHELFEIVEIFQNQTTEALEASIKKAFASGYKTLVFETPKEVNAAALPNYWKLGIEEEHKMTPEQTVKFHRHLLELGWRQEKYQGKTTWLKPQTQTRRTGESTIGQIATK